PIWAERVLDDPLEAAYHYSLAGELLPAVETLTAQLQTLLNRGQALTAAQEVDRMLARARLKVPAAGAQPPEVVRRLLLARGDLLVNTPRAAEAEANYGE